MRTANRHGFTLLEVMVASIVLTAGIGALLGTAAATTRMVLRGRQATRALQAATGQVEALRGAAVAAPGSCAGLPDGADSGADGSAWSWTVARRGDLRDVVLVVSVPIPGGRDTDTLSASLWCP